MLAGVHGGGDGAVAPGCGVSLWLTGEAAWFAAARAGRGVRARRARRRWPQLLRRGARRRDGDGVHAVRGPARHRRPEDLLPGVRIAGAAAFVAEATADDAQALVY